MLPAYIHTYIHTVGGGEEVDREWMEGFGGAVRGNVRRSWKKKGKKETNTTKT